MVLNVLPFAILGIFGRVRKEARTGKLTYDDSLAIKGIAALLIVFAHSYSLLLNKGYSIGIGKVWLLTGGIGVCLFFFLSGYGLNISNGVEKKNYIWRRIKGVLVPYLILELIFFIGETPCSDSNVFEFFQYLIGSWDSSWFVIEIFLIYIGYYICFLLFGRKKLNISMLFFNMGIGLIFIFLKLEPKWYNGHLLFSVGMYMADYNVQIVNYLRKKNWWFNNVVGAIIYLSFSIIFIANKEIVWLNIFKVLSGVCMCFILVNIMLCYRFQSKQLLWIGKNSLLIYIIHGQVLQLLRIRDTISNASILFIAGLLITFAAIAIYNLAENVLNKLIKRIMKRYRGK